MTPETASDSLLETYVPTEFILDAVAVGSSLLIGLVFLWLGVRTFQKGPFEDLQTRVLGGAYLFLGSLAVGGVSRLAGGMESLLGMVCPLLSLGFIAYLFWRWLHLHPMVGQTWRLPGIGDVEVIRVHMLLLPLVEYVRVGDDPDEIGTYETLVWAFIFQGTRVEPVVMGAT